jgi:PP-loop superfamily ATP-utilizing enzyme
MKKFISFSGGVESTTMCLLYGKGATALVADTGDEEPEMYARWEYVATMLNAIHDGDFQILFLKPEVKTKGYRATTLIEVANIRKHFPSIQRRWCTKELKIDPIDKFLSAQGECELMIGFNADEEPGKDRTGSFMKCENVKYTYPLYEAGVTREDCIAMLEEKGLAPSFPPYMQRGGCRKCFFRTKKEAKAKYFFKPCWIYRGHGI